MERSCNQNLDSTKKRDSYSPDQIVKDIDQCLLEEEVLLAALVEAVRYNNLDEATAEAVYFNFLHNPPETT